jgi:LmbE family N-acetylglucosaminyl deacetylase
MSLPYVTIEQFVTALDRMERPVAILAHQDDEVAFGGTLARVGDRARLVWVTNGDGLYYDANVSPKQYGEIRKAEALKSAAAVGIAAKRTECLDYSEVEIYRRLSYVTQNAEAAIWLRPWFTKMLDDIRDRVFALRPEAVFVCAYQGGNPEHDLTHYFARLAVDDYEHETGKKIPFVHVPMYEYIVAVALRFNPFYPGLRWRYELQPGELTRKVSMYEAYPSQIDLFEKFQKIIQGVGLLTKATRGHGLTIEEYLGVEEYGPVAEEWDYLKNPHTLDRANYIGDHFAGIPVSFDASIRPIVAAFPRRI